MVLERDDAELEDSTTRWSVIGVVLLWVFVLAFPVYRLIEPSRRDDARAERITQIGAVGEEIFTSTCTSCHGPEGIGGIGPAVGAQEFLSATSDAQIGDLVAAGVPGSQMAAYSAEFGGTLTRTQVDAVVAYLRGLEDDAPSNPGWRFPLEAAGLDGPQLFQMACSSCHGTSLEGGIGPELGRGSDAADDSDSRIASRISNGKDEMPSFSGSLSEAQIASIIDFLRQEQSSS